MKRWGLCLVVLILFILPACACQSETEEDIPEFSQDEVIAIVKRDLLERPFGDSEVIGSSDYTAKYIGQGKWQGSCQIHYLAEKDMPPALQSLLGSSAKLEYQAELDINWHFYEKSQTVEIISE